jgi:hypothetical protein
MKRQYWCLVGLLGILVGWSTCPVLGGEESPFSVEEPPVKTGQSEQDKTPGNGLSESEQWFRDYKKAYMSGNWEKYDELVKTSAQMSRELDADARRDIAYMRNSVADFRPLWWKNCQSSSAITFKANIWNRQFTANYMPSQSVGHQSAGIMNGQVVALVSWRPEYVGSQKTFNNEEMMRIHGIYVPRAEEFGFSMGTMAETIAWHELGHNYITISLTAEQLITLYREHRLLFGCLQEFYADLTALYHGYPDSRLFTFLFRTAELEHYDEGESHCRGCAHGTGALILHRVLMDPDSWPSFHLPGKVPPSNVEINTIKYLRANVDTNWSLEEDRNLRMFLKKWIFTHGANALRQKGRILLPSKQVMYLVYVDDREEQRKRDEWVKTRLEMLIKAGKTDPPEMYDAFEQAGLEWSRNAANPAPKPKEGEPPAGF